MTAPSPLVGEGWGGGQHRAHLVLACLALASLLPLAGCGSDENTTPPASLAAPSPTAAPSPNPTASAPHAPPETPSAVQQPRSRRFVFHYAATITHLPAGAAVRVWMPVATSDDDQDVEQLGEPPLHASVATEPKFGNRIMYFETAAPPGGELAFDVPYRVVRREVRALTGASHAAQQKLSDLQRQLYLRADTKVPIDGKPLELLQGVRLPDKPLDLARQLYRTVDDHMRYEKKGTGWGQGDSVWACTSGYGNCTDFHSLFISLARANHLPARFVIGFPLPPSGADGTIAGYHCWAYFYLDDLGWVPVDISEADKHPEMKDYYFGNLTADRVAFSTGRDLNLVPPQQGPPLNFFVYPYVELDGKPLDKEQLTLQFRCEDE